jgi:hypothetical protein
MRRLIDVRLGRIEVDGMDVTSVISGLLRHLKFDVIFTSGITFAGFNVLNTSKLHEATRKPVIVISGERPDNAAVKAALQKHFVDWDYRWALIESLGRLHTFRPIHHEPQIYFEVIGISPVLARGIIRSFCFISRIPEPLRVARLVARGLNQISCQA